MNLLFGLRSLFSRKPQHPEGPTAEHALLRSYSACIETRLAERTEPLEEALAQFFASGLPEDCTGLHFEVQHDAFPFDLTCFCKREESTREVWETTTGALGASLATLFPIMTQEEADEYMIWEDDPKWGRQVAIEQPIDAFDVSGVVQPWLKARIRATCGSCSLPITVGVHDLDEPTQV